MSILTNIKFKQVESLASTPFEAGSFVIAKDGIRFDRIDPPPTRVVLV